MNKQSNNSPLYTIISILNFAKTWTFWSQLVLAMLITMPTTFSLSSLTGSSFINRYKINIKQNWVQLFGAALRNVPSFSRGLLGILIAHCCLWWMLWRFCPEFQTVYFMLFSTCMISDRLDITQEHSSGCEHRSPTHMLFRLSDTERQPTRKKTHCLKGRGTRMAQLRWTESLN